MLRLPTQKHIRQSSEDSGGSYYFYTAVYDRDGKQMAAVHGPCSETFARKTIVPIVLSAPVDRMKSNAARKSKNRGKKYG